MIKGEIIQSINFGSDVAEHESKALAKYFVETDQWYRISEGGVDVIYGAKGSGKSAIYHLIMSREGDFFDRDILLVPAENPDEDPAFMEIRSDLPPTESEFTGFWKLYFCSLAAVRARDAGVKNQQLKEVLDLLAGLDLVEKHISLNTIIKNISDYAKRAFRPSEVSSTTHFDPTSGTLTGITAKISLGEPTKEARAAGIRPIRELLAKLNEALEISGQTIWLLLDRLDVAFAEFEEVETRALRALFGAYKDMSGLNRIKLKLFIRTDIWDRITAGGFREAPHAGSPTKSITLRWDNALLFNLFLKRLLQSDTLCARYNIDRNEILSDVLEQEHFINRIFPDKIDTGKNPRTFAWISGRLQDGKNETMPRELIQFCSALRAEQLQRLEKANNTLPGELLFERASFKAALTPISKNRLDKTIYAEHPGCRAWIQSLRGRKSLQSAETLGGIWDSELDHTRDRIDYLVKIGIFRELLSDKETLFEIPILYRPGLQIIRGAEIGLKIEAQKNVETDANDIDNDE